MLYPEVLNLKIYRSGLQRREVLGSSRTHLNIQGQKIVIKYQRCCGHWINISQWKSDFNCQTWAPWIRCEACTCVNAFTTACTDWSMFNELQLNHLALYSPPTCVRSNISVVIWVHSWLAPLSTPISSFSQYYTGNRQKIRKSSGIPSPPVASDTKNGAITRLSWAELGSPAEQVFQPFLISAEFELTEEV